MVELKKETATLGAAGATTTGFDVGSGSSEFPVSSYNVTVTIGIKLHTHFNSCSISTLDTSREPTDFY